MNDYDIVNEVNDKTPLKCRVCIENESTNYNGMKCYLRVCHLCGNIHLDGTYGNCGP